MSKILLFVLFEGEVEGEGEVVVLAPSAVIAEIQRA